MSTFRIFPEISTKDILKANCCGLMLKSQVKRRGHWEGDTYVVFKYQIMVKVKTKVGDFYVFLLR